MIVHLNMFFCNLTSNKNQGPPNIKYLLFLLPFLTIIILSDPSKSKLKISEIIVKGTIMATILTVPSLIAFLITWTVLDNLINAAIVGGIVHFIAMGFSLKISKKILVKK